MTLYADFNFYRDTYKGTMGENDFSKHIAKASALITSATFGRIKPANIPDEVKYCACELADKCYAVGKSEGKQSETVGAHSVSYASGNTTSQSDIYRSVIKSYLSEVYAEDGTPVLYGGVDCVS